MQRLRIRPPAPGERSTMRRGALVLAALAGAMPILSATPVSATPAGPDLAVLAVTPSVPTATPGQRVTVEAVAVNHGPGARPPAVATRAPALPRAAAPRTFRAE